MAIKMTNVSKDYPEGCDARIKALDSINLHIEKGEFICLLGPSGCGKTTLLNLMAGFERPTGGSITINDEAIQGPSIRNVTIFQDYGLLPWRTILGNVELGLEALGMDRKSRRGVALHYIELVGLHKFCKSHPHQLSGGMRQRVAIARALAVDPDILFMDEPFGALDALTRIKMQDEITQLWEQKKKTIVFVTHDIEEAIFLADRIVIMSPNPGRIKSMIPVQMGRKRDRRHPDFLRIRDRVFGEFELEEKDRTEYRL